MSGISAIIVCPLPENEREARLLVGDFRRVTEQCCGQITITPMGPAALIRADFPQCEELPDNFVAFSNRAYEKAERPGEITLYSMTLYDYTSGALLPACRFAA